MKCNSPFNITVSQGGAVRKQWLIGNVGVEWTLIGGARRISAWRDQTAFGNDALQSNPDIRPYYILTLQEGNLFAGPKCAVVTISPDVLNTKFTHPLRVQFPCSIMWTSAGTGSYIIEYREMGFWGNLAMQELFQLIPTIQRTSIYAPYPGTLVGDPAFSTADWSVAQIGMVGAIIRAPNDIDFLAKIHGGALTVSNVTTGTSQANSGLGYIGSDDPIVVPFPGTAKRYSWNGIINEICVWSGALTDQERDDEVSRLNGIYGI